jgi:branched-chain amino acid transport system ATP-binding protein
MPRLEVEELSVAYGHIVAVRGVSLTVEEGEVVALLGANGAGKTTTLKAIAGLLRPRSGHIRWGGREIGGLSADRVVAQGISLCPEGRSIFGPMTVEENLLLGAFLRPRQASVTLRQVYDLFPVLHERRHSLAGTLSGGEQQMLAIGRSLMAEPNLFLLDEPSLGLAPVLADRMMDTVREIRRRGTAVLLVEQNATLALEVADRALVLEAGSVALTGSAAALRDDPHVRAAYLGDDTEAAAAP